MLFLLLLCFVVVKWKDFLLVLVFIVGGYVLLNLKLKFFFFSVFKSWSGFFKVVLFEIMSILNVNYFSNVVYLSFN